MSDENRIEILKNQKAFKWQNICPYYNDYKSSFDYHVQHHPIDERNSGKWDSLIDYNNWQTISDSYYKSSVDLSKKYELTLTKDYSFNYRKKHDSYNILDNNNDLMVCLKYNKRNQCFDIATCYFPSKKIVNLFYKNDRNEIKQDFYKQDFNNWQFIMNIDNNIHNVKNVNDYKEAMREFFGIDSIEYKILFNNEKNNIDDIINKVTNDTMAYLNLMENLIKDEDDKKYYFVYDDGIEYIVKLSLLYKIKDKNYEKLYQKFLNIDINDSYKEALDECKKYIDDGEKV